MKDVLRLVNARIGQMIGCMSGFGRISCPIPRPRRAFTGFGPCGLSGGAPEIDWDADFTGEIPWGPEPIRVVRWARRTSPRRDREASVVLLASKRRYLGTPKRGADAAPDNTRN